MCNVRYKILFRFLCSRIKENIYPPLIASDSGHWGFKGSYGGSHPHSLRKELFKWYHNLLFCQIKKARFFRSRLFYMQISLLLYWRETSSNSIITELTIAKSITTRKAPSNEKIVSGLGNIMG